MRCASPQLSAHLFIFGSEISSAVHDLGASILNDLPTDWDVGHTILPAVGVSWLKKREDAACWGRKDVGKPSGKLRCIYFLDVLIWLSLLKMELVAKYHQNLGFLTVLFDDGDVDKTLSNLSDAEGHIHSLNLQFLLVVVFVFDKKWHMHIH